MAASTVAVTNQNSLLPSQSIFNEIQSIHETGFFHEIEFLVREEAAANSYTTVCTLQN